MRVVEVQIERINDGVLCSFEGGATMWFESKEDAQAFGQNLMMVAALGGNVLDEPIEESET